MKHAMRPIRETIALDEALALILEAAAPVARSERVALGAADGRVLAAPVTAAMDVAPFHPAAIDGFPGRAAGTFGGGRHHPKTVRAVEKVYTGQLPQKRVGAGECIEIATG